MFARMGCRWAFASLAILICLFASGHAVHHNDPGFDLQPKNIFILSMPTSGHANPLVVLAHELASRGHNITFVTGSTYNVPAYARNSAIHFHFIPETMSLTQRFDTALTEMSKPSAEPFLKTLDLLNLLRIAIKSVGTLEFQMIQEVLQTTKPGSVDLVIGGVFVSPAANVLSQVLGVPCIVHYFVYVMDFVKPLGIFVSSLTTSALETDAEPHMSVLTSITVIINRILFSGISNLRLRERQFIYNKVKTELAQYLPATEKPAQPVVNLISNAWGFHPAQLAVPSTRMAGIWVPEAQSLDVQPDLKHWLDSASRPVVYVSTGTMAHPSNETLLAFYEAFSATTEFQTLWSLKKVFQNTLRELLGDQEWPEHVRIENFVPQLAVLDHPAVQIFFTHGGWNSVSEGLWTGTPMLGMPFFGDQPYNVAKLVHLGLGLKIDKNIMSSPDKAATIQLIQDKLHTILRDPSFSSRSKHFQKTFQVMGGVKKGANIVEEILAIGDTTVYSFSDNTNAVVAAMAILGLTGAAVTFGIYRLGAWGLGRLFGKRTPSIKAKAE
ncbi:uncharacterized protein BJ171DRAFT_30098 [Polychytrium aggregatum]|uniref:uncharacterized protein n=1 Tax=Polychytrium aggregatum TaxID=110093 RepID=UPI0022FE8E8D|nr:uncharacterized protein BJ171DRAFT_30098 [Polychytrium aggregatum]KAI9206416.1 hypothetical protein BJ171DRAFT_30098 [Polychytrium aggregatum]